MLEFEVGKLRKLGKDGGYQEDAILCRWKWKRHGGLRQV
jgi:hypothetical protein